MLLVALNQSNILIIYQEKKVKFLKEVKFLKKVKVLFQKKISTLIIIIKIYFKVC